MYLRDTPSCPRWLLMNVPASSFPWMASNPVSTIMMYLSMKYLLRIMTLCWTCMVQNSTKFLCRNICILKFDNFHCNSNKNIYKYAMEWKHRNPIKILNKRWKSEDTKSHWRILDLLLSIIIKLCDMETVDCMLPPTCAAHAKWFSVTPPTTFCCKMLLPWLLAVNSNIHIFVTYQSKKPLSPGLGNTKVI